MSKVCVALHVQRWSVLAIPDPVVTVCAIIVARFGHHFVFAGFVLAWPELCIVIGAVRMSVWIAWSRVRLLLLDLKPQCRHLYLSG